jgi:hypothetical protein
MGHMLHEVLCQIYKLKPIDIPSEVDMATWSHGITLDTTYSPRTQI